jgi:tRNA dimethylallyltransferase
MSSGNPSKILILGGQTATGKTDTYFRLNQEFPSLFEAVIVDSRQIYQQLSIGTGKDIPHDFAYTQVDQIIVDQQPYNIGYHRGDSGTIWLHNAALPNQPFSSAVYRRLALQCLSHIHRNGHIPVLVGGTGLYIKAIIEPPETLLVPQNHSLRQQLNALTIDQLQSRLKTKDPHRFNTMNQSDQNNPRRLIRAIEVASESSSTPKPSSKQKINTYLACLSAPKAYLSTNILKRIQKRLSQGMVDEVKNLHDDYPDFLSYQASHTPGYHEIANYLSGSITLKQATEKWFLKELQYAKRQETWFKKQSQFHWFDITSPSWYATLVTQLKEWLYASSPLQN